jgi:peptidoglycan hydrolase FlgJ
MSAIALPASSFDATLATKNPAVTSAAELAKRGHTHQTAVNFEASFLSSMMQNMFEGISSEPPFGGGPGEDMWKSFLSDAMAKTMAKRGGIGLSKPIEREMLKLQGLTESAA